MSRYIDADKTLEELQEEIDFDTPMYTEEQNKYFEMGLRCAYRDVQKQPTADVVEVVRCKDCAYYREETSYCLNPRCSSSFYGHRVKENHYCSYGERREE